MPALGGVQTVGSQAPRDTSVPCKGYRCYSEKLVCVHKHSVLEINHPGAGKGRKTSNQGWESYCRAVLLQACEQAEHHCRAVQLYKAAQGAVAGKLRKGEEEREVGRRQGEDRDTSSR